MSKREVFRGDYLKRVTIDPSSQDAVTTLANGSHHFTGAMRLSTGVIYMAVLRGEGKDKYNATEPKAFIGNRSGLSLCAGQAICSITHNNKGVGTSHDNIVNHVKGCLGGDVDDSDFCGFTVRFRGVKANFRKTDQPLYGGKGLAELSPTSRSLNPSGNGQLEMTLLEAIHSTLSPLVFALGFNRLMIAGPGVDPQTANAMKASGGKASQTQINLRRGMFAQLLSKNA